MPIPDYQTLMLPLLKMAGDGVEHTSREAFELLAKEFNLTDSERKELLPSGQQSLFENRVGWAKTYLKQAGLIDSPKKAVFSITNLGLDVLKRNPEKIDKKYLLEFESFRTFLKVDNLNTEQNQITQMIVEQDTNSKESPEETIGRLVKGIEKYLAAELLERIKNQTPQFFEELVVELLLRMGYGNTKEDILQNTGKSGDEGIDGIIKQDSLGLDKIYIQAKRWQNCIGSPQIDGFAGALQKQNASKGIFITTSSFTSNAIEAVPRYSQSNIVLIDGQKLTELMIKHNLGVVLKQPYEVKKIDEDFFID